MWTFIARKFFYALLILLAVSIIDFFIVWVQPGDMLNGCEFSASEETCNDLRKQLGLDQPFMVQYANWIRGIVCCTDAMDTSDPAHPRSIKVWSLNTHFPFVHFQPYWGKGFSVRQPVTEALFGKGGKIFFFSIIVIGIITLFIWMIMIPIGIYAATYKYSTASHSFSFLGFVERYFRSNLLDVLALPYVKTDHVKQPTEAEGIIYKHTVRNVTSPPVMIFGYWIPAMVDSLLVAAGILNIPVIGREFWLALVTQDQPVMMVWLLYFSLILLVGNLIADIMLFLSDLRIRYD